MAIGAHALKFLPVQIICCRTSLAEEKPVAAFGAQRTPLMQESAKRRNACAGADHDDRRIRILRQFELLVGLDVDREPVGERGAIRKKSGANAAALATVRSIANHRHGCVNLTLMSQGAR